jgi:hypothetical protein
VFYQVSSELVWLPNWCCPANIKMHANQHSGSMQQHEKMSTEQKQKVEEKLDTLSLRTTSTASSAKYNLSWERIFKLRVVIAIFIRSDLNLSDSAKGDYS